MQLNYLFITDANGNLDPEAPPANYGRRRSRAVLYQLSGHYTKDRRKSKMKLQNVIKLSLRRFIIYLEFNVKSTIKYFRVYLSHRTFVQLSNFVLQSCSITNPCFVLSKNIVLGERQQIPLRNFPLKTCALNNNHDF